MAAGNPRNLDTTKVDEYFLTHGPSMDGPFHQTKIDPGAACSSHGPSFDSHHKEPSTMERLDKALATVFQQQEMIKNLQNKLSYTTAKYRHLRKQVDQADRHMINTLMDNARLRESVSGMDGIFPDHEPTDYPESQPVSDSVIRFVQADKRGEIVWSGSSTRAASSSE